MTRSTHIDAGPAQGGVVDDSPHWRRAACGWNVPRSTVADDPSTATCRDCRAQASETEQRIAELLQRKREEPGASMLQATWTGGPDFLRRLAETLSDPEEAR